MSSTPQSRQLPAPSAAHLRADHARFLARRMLAGAGAVELTAYRAGETLSSAVHGVSRTGQLVVADIPNLFHSLGAFHTSGAIEVRVDVVRDCIDPTLPLRLASLHLLGTLTWCRDTAEVDALGLQGRVADLVQDVGPRVRVGVIDTDRILLHDCSGITAHGSSILPEASAATAALDTLDTLDDAVMATDAEILADIADAVLDGDLPGWGEPLALPASTDVTAVPAHGVDTDRRCVTLARFAGEEAWVVQVPLPAQPHSTSVQDSVTAWRNLVDHVSARSVSTLRP